MSVHTFLKENYELKNTKRKSTHLLILIFVLLATRNCSHVFFTETFRKEVTYPENTARIKRVRQCADNALQFRSRPDEGSPASRAMEKKRERGRDTKREREKEWHRQNETEKDLDISY